MNELKLVVTVCKNMSLKIWLIVLGISFLPYFFTKMIVPSVVTFLIVLFYIVKDALSYKVALIAIILIALFAGATLYIWKPLILLSLLVAVSIVHYGIKNKLPIATALRNELIYLLGLCIILLSLLIGVLTGNVSIVQSSGDSYIATLAIILGAILYIGYSIYQAYRNYQKYRG